MNYYLTLVPAYGRDYKSQKEVKAAWEEGKDFEIRDISSPYNGKMMSIRDAEKGWTYNIRYSKLMKIVSIKVKE